MKEWAKSFYKSKAWRDCRDAYFISKHGLCERCNCKAGTIVHHKVYLTPQNINDPNVTIKESTLEPAGFSHAEFQCKSRIET